MSIHWRITDGDLVMVDAVGRVSRSDIEGYLAATILSGAKGHKKLFSLIDGQLALSSDDLDGVAKALARYGQGEPPGPVAIVVSGTLNLDMAMLLKQRVGSRPFRVFVAKDAALEWLTFFDDTLIPPVRAFGQPRGGGWRRRPIL